MEKELKLEIFDKERIKILSLLKIFKADYRDYLDIYFILLNNSLESVLEVCKKKYNEFDQSLYLKALLSYDDIEETPIKFLPGKEKKPKEVFTFIEKKVKLFLTRAV